MTVGTEHEYLINDEHFTALPVSDQIIKSICGRFTGEIRFGEVNLGKELQKTVLEFVPRVPASRPGCPGGDACAGHQEILPRFS